MLAPSFLEDDRGLQKYYFVGDKINFFKKR